MPLAVKAPKSYRNESMDGISQKTIKENGLMFERMKEKARQLQEEQERRDREEKSRLMSLSEKELLVEILLALKDIEVRVNDVENAVRLQKYN